MQELLQKRAALIKQQEDILAAMKAENRNMTVDEKSTWDKVEAAIVDVEDNIECMKSFQSRTNGLDDSYMPSNFDGMPKNNAEPFSFGELCQAAIALAAPTRIRNAADILNRFTSVKNAASGLSANVPVDGGFLIGATRSNEIMKKVYEGGEITSKCSVFEVGQYSDSFEVPYLEENSRAAGSRWGGLRAYREGEVDTPTKSQPATGRWECRLTDMKSLIYLTERMMEDAPAIESLVMELMPQEFQYKLQDEILNGQGGIQCTGVIGHPATVSVAKESGQAAKTILANNIINMYSRCWGKGRSNAAWYYNQDVEPQLFSLTFDVGTGGVPVFLPANGLSGSPYATLFGRPLIPVEQAKTLGTVGDIIFGNFGEYALVRKGGLRSASSIHVKFLTDELTLKFSMRVNGKPKWKKALTPANGTNDLAPIVTLATRS